MKNLFVGKIRYYLVFFGVICAFGSVGGRLVWLQVWNADKFLKLLLMPGKKLLRLKPGVEILSTRRAICWQRRDLWSKWG